MSRIFFHFEKVFESIVHFVVSKPANHYTGWSGYNISKEPTENDMCIIYHSRRSFVCYDDDDIIGLRIAAFSI